MKYEINDYDQNVVYIPHLNCNDLFHSANYYATINASRN